MATAVWAPSRIDRNRLAHAVHGNASSHGREVALEPAWPRVDVPPERIEDTPGSFGAIGLFVVGMRADGEVGDAVSELARSLLQTMDVVAPLRGSGVLWTSRVHSDPVEVFFHPSQLAWPMDALSAAPQVPILAIIDYRRTHERIELAMRHIISWLSQNHGVLVILAHVDSRPEARPLSQQHVVQLCRRGAWCLMLDNGTPPWGVIREGLMGGLADAPALAPWITHERLFEQTLRAGDMARENEARDADRPASLAALRGDAIRVAKPAIGVSRLRFTGNDEMNDIHVYGLRLIRGAWIHEEATGQDMIEEIIRLFGSMRWRLHSDGHAVEADTLLRRFAGRIIRATPLMPAGMPPRRGGAPWRGIRR